MLTRYATIATHVLFHFTSTTQKLRAASTAWIILPNAESQHSLPDKCYAPQYRKEKFYAKKVTESIMVASKTLKKDISLVQAAAIANHRYCHQCNSTPSARSSNPWPDSYQLTECISPATTYKYNNNEFVNFLSILIGN
jgi:hypothetical protein